MAAQEPQVSPRETRTSLSIELYDTAQLACECLEQLDVVLGYLATCDDSRRRDALVSVARNTVETYGVLLEDTRANAAASLRIATSRH